MMLCAGHDIPFGSILLDLCCRHIDMCYTHRNFLIPQQYTHTNILNWSCYVGVNTITYSIVAIGLLFLFLFTDGL
jgi:hypothetical protein